MTDPDQFDELRFWVKAQFQFLRRSIGQRTRRRGQAGAGQTAVGSPREAG